MLNLNSLPGVKQLTKSNGKVYCKKCQTFIDLTHRIVAHSTGPLYVCMTCFGKTAKDVYLEVLIQ